MRRPFLLLGLCALAASATAARATPSTVFWTPATTYVQPWLVPHLTYDTYVSTVSAFQNDYGVTVGLLPLEKLQAELGVDSFMPGLQSANLYLNGKVGVPEGALAAWAPGLSAGVYGAGFKRDVSDFDILHAEVGKTLPVIGNLTAGGYYALNDRLMLGSDGKATRAGLMASWTSPDVVLNLPGLNKLVLVADVQTGRNAFGAAGGGIGLYFTPSIDLLTGPVFFFDSRATAQVGAPGNVVGALRPDWLWTVQLDVDLDLRPAKKT